MIEDYSGSENLILSRLEMVEMEDGDYIVEDKDSGRFFKINSSVHFILSSIQQGKSIPEIIAEYNSLYTNDITTESVESLFQQLSGFGIFKSPEKIIVSRRKKSPIFFRVRLMSEYLTEKVSRFFCVFFHPKLWPIIFTFSVVFVIVFLITQYNALGGKSSSSIVAKFIYFFLLLFFQIFHEIGHAAAGLSFGIKAKEIGFGFFYGIIPVFYSDQTRIWKLPARERIVVNLGGIYFDFLTSSFLILFWFFIKWDFFLMYPYVIIGTTLRNLNIFLRYDGYWVVSDLVKSDSLLVESNYAIRLFVREGALIQPKKKRRSMFMILYGILNYTYIAIFVLIIFVSCYQNIFDFPSFVWSIFHCGSPTEMLTMIEEKGWNAIFFPLVFYVVIIVSAFRYISKRRLQSARS